MELCQKDTGMGLPGPPIGQMQEYTSIKQNDSDELQCTLFCGKKKKAMSLLLSSERGKVEREMAKTVLYRRMWKDVPSF